MLDGDIKELSGNLEQNNANKTAMGKVWRKLERLTSRVLMQQFSELRSLAPQWSIVFDLCIMSIVFFGLILGGPESP